MDRVLFLHSAGGIISRYPHLRSEEPLPVAPYVERIALPVVSVDSSALYGEHPENLATLTYSSGAALTFFCDSVAGGADSSGDGSFDDPWRSLKTASKFLSCHSPLLGKAAPYTQLKIRGTVDYIVGEWSPWGRFQNNAGKLILTGWGERCDLGTADFYAGYFFDLRAKVGSSAAIACSGCTLFQPGAAKALAVDCEIESGGYVSCAYNCSGGEVQSRGTRDFYASVCHGGSWEMRISANYAYAPVVSVSAADLPISYGMVISNAAVGAQLTVSGSRLAVGIVGGNRCEYLGGCIVNVTATDRDRAGDDGNDAMASACVFKGAVSAVSGGTWTALASASGGARYSRSAEAWAEASGFNAGITVNNAAVVLTASATAHLATALSGNQEEVEHELICNGGSSSWISRVRRYSNGVIRSSYISSGSR